MKILLLVFTVFAAPAFAEGMLTLAPGSSAIVQSGERTQVFCAATMGLKCSCAKQTSGKYCARYFNFQDGDFYCAGPGNTSSSFDSQEDCLLALPSIPICY